MNAPGGFETTRLIVRELHDDDLEAISEVHVSNPEYIELTSGAGGEPGRFDLEMLQRDFVVARVTPGRSMAGIFLRESGEAIGVLDWMERNPSDGKPWVGLLMIRADRQRRGLASEAFAGLVDRLRALGASSVRASVVARSVPGRALARSLRFEPVSTTTTRMASVEEVIVVERTL